MAQMRAARGSQIPKKIISIMMPKEEQRMKDQLSTNEETKKTGKWKTDNDWKKDSYWDVLKILPKQCLNSCHCFEEQFVWPRCSETCFRYTYHCGQIYADKWNKFSLSVQSLLFLSFGEISPLFICLIPVAVLRSAANFLYLVDKNTLESCPKHVKHSLSVCTFSYHDCKPY